MNLNKFCGLNNLVMPRLYLCPDAGAHPSEKLGEVTRHYGQRPSPSGNPEGGHLVGPPKDMDVLEERDVVVGSSSCCGCHGGQ